MKKLLLSILAIILLASVSSALLQRTTYNPWTRTLDYTLSSNQTNSNFTFNDINVTGVITGNGSGITGITSVGTLSSLTVSGAVVFSLGLNWTYLTNYPAGCPEGTYVTLNGDSNTCTAAVRPTGDVMTGDLNFTNSAGIRNVSLFTAATALDIGSFDFRALSFTSDVAQGTSPFVVTSSTVVANLNASFSNSTNNLVGGANIDITGFINTSGNITSNNIVTTNPIHCHSYRTTAQTITNTSEYVLIGFDTNVECIAITTDTENFTISVAGDYRVTVDLFADKTGGGTTVLEAVILKNGIVINGTASQRTVSSNNEIGFFGINVAIDVIVNDVLSIGLTGQNNLAQLDSDCLLCLENVTARITIDKEN